MRRIPLWLKIFWTIWVIVWTPVYWRQYGAQNFLFFCDIGNILIAVGLWLESSLIFSWQAVSLLLVQTLFTLDLTIAFVTGRHLTGGTEYMFDQENIPLPVRLLSLFHVVTPPLLLWAILRLGYDPRGWKYQVATACIVVPINHYWRREFDVNWAAGPFFREQHIMPGFLYLFLYLMLMTALVYWPTHRLLTWFAQRDMKR